MAEAGGIIRRRADMKDALHRLANIYVESKVCTGAAASVSVHAGRPWMLSCCL